MDGWRGGRAGNAQYPGAELGGGGDSSRGCHPDGSRWGRWGREGAVGTLHIQCVSRMVAEDSRGEVLCSS